MNIKGARFVISYDGMGSEGSESEKKTAQRSCVWIDSQEKEVKAMVFVARGTHDPAGWHAAAAPTEVPQKF